MPSRTVRLITLGCKVNQYETQYVKEALEANGYREAAASEAADLCVVNTCTVTAEGDAGPCALRWCRSRSQNRGARSMRHIRAFLRTSCRRSNRRSFHRPRTRIDVA